MGRPARCTINRPDTRSRAPRKAERKAPDHLAWLRSLDCPVFPGRRPIEAHHLLQATEGDDGVRQTNRGTGMKSPDRWAVPLSKRAHDELHAHGDEIAWQGLHHVDLHAIAARLWSISGDTPAALTYLHRISTQATLARIAAGGGRHGLETGKTVRRGGAARGVA